ncbi:hypothetical protein V8G54_027448 [Vigna mungo]|uniref:Uncharacterized protein n=1 Tax=Vigna mungo TaxID=3915 RepID=A0AAQ3N1W6_VIGMU
MVVSPQCPSCVGGVLKAIKSVGWIGGEKLGVKGKNGWGLTSPKSSVCVWKKNVDHPPMFFSDNGVCDLSKVLGILPSSLSFDRFLRKSHSAIQPPDKTTVKRHSSLMHHW